MGFSGTSLMRKGFRNSTPGMGIDSMSVGGGRCPFLIVGGLLVVCVMLLFNWWALAAENSELLRQIDELSDQLKYSVDERDKCVTHLGDAQEDLKRSKAENSFLHVQLEQQNDLKKRNNDLKESIAVCKGDLDLLKQIEASKKDENLKLKEDLNKMKNEVDKLRTSVNVLPQVKPMNVAELILPKIINSEVNDVIDGSNTDNYNQRRFKVTDQDIAAEQV